MSDFEALPPIPVTFTITDGTDARAFARYEVPGESVCRWWKIACEIEDGSVWETHVFPSLTPPRIHEGTLGCKKLTLIEVEAPS